MTLKTRKRSYIANIVDKQVDKENYSRISYINHRHKVFCKCGNDFEINDLKSKLIEVPYVKSVHDNLINSLDLTHNTFGQQIVKWPIFENPITCDSCKETHGDYSNLIKLNRFNNNIIAVGIKIYLENKNEHLIKLSCFQKNIGVSNTTKKLFSKFKKTSLVFNKKTKTLFLTGDGILKKVGSSFLKITLDKFFDNSHKRINMIFKKEGGHELFHKEMNVFLEEMFKFIDNRDSCRIKEILDRELILLDYKNSGLSNLYYRNKLMIYVSLINYPALSNILFMKGVHFFIDFLNFEGKPSFKQYKRKGLTNPYEIIEYSISYSNVKVKKAYSHDVFYQTITQRRLKGLKIGKQLLKSLKVNSDGTSFDKNFYDTFGLSLDILAKSCFLKNIDYNNLIIFFTTIKGYDFYVLNQVLNQFKECDLRQLKHIISLSKTILPKPEKYKKINANIAWLINDNVNLAINNAEGVDENGFVNKYLYSNFSLHVYIDVLRLYNLFEIENDAIFKIKNWKDLVDLHDDLTERIKLINLEKFNEQIELIVSSYKNLDETIGNIKFETIKSAIGIEKEGKEMNHCVGGYVKSVANGECIIIKITDTENDDRATMELKTFDSFTEAVEGYLFTFSQLKSKHNRPASEKIIGATIEYLKKHKAKFDKNNYDFAILENKK